MVIEFPCKKCGRMLRGGEGAAGNRVLCAKCGTFTDVPDEIAGTPPEGDPAGMAAPGELPGQQQFPPPADAGTIFGENNAQSGTEGSADPDAGVYDFAEPEPPRAETEVVGPPPPIRLGSSAGTSAPPPRADSGNPYQSPAQHNTTTWEWSQNDNRDNMAIISLVVGLVGFPLSCCCGLLAIPTGIAAVGLGIPALQGKNQVIAIAGVVLGALQIFWGVVILIISILGNFG